MAHIAIFGPESYGNRSTIFQYLNLVARQLGVRGKDLHLLTSSFGSLASAVEAYAEEFNVAELRHVPLKSAVTLRAIVNFGPDVVILFHDGTEESEPVEKILAACQKADIEPAVFDI